MTSQLTTVAAGIEATSVSVVGLSSREAVVMVSVLSDVVVGRSRGEW